MPSVAAATGARLAVVAVVTGLAVVAAVVHALPLSEYPGLVPQQSIACYTTGCFLTLFLDPKEA